jgi:hypothetical protein
MRQRYKRYVIFDFTNIVNPNLYGRIRIRHHSEAVQTKRVQEILWHAHGVILNRERMCQTQHDRLIVMYLVLQSLIVRPRLIFALRTVQPILSFFGPHIPNFAEFVTEYDNNTVY